jgi:hypothetical protein
MSLGKPACALTSRKACRYVAHSVDTVVPPSKALIAIQSHEAIKSSRVARAAVAASASLWAVYASSC